MQTYGCARIYPVGLTVVKPRTDGLREELDQGRRWICQIEFHGLANRMEFPFQTEDTGGH